MVLHLLLWGASKMKYSQSDSLAQERICLHKCVLMHLVMEQSFFWLVLYLRKIIIGNENVLVKVKGNLNSRPISYVSDIEEILTPAHLIVGYQLLACQTHLYVTNTLILKTFIQTPNEALILSVFWRRWRLEYLTKLCEFHRHHNSNNKKQCFCFSWRYSALFFS